MHGGEELLRRYTATAKAVAAELKRHPKVIGIALCGSIVTGELWEGSDLDMLVVMRGVEADWQAMTVRHAGLRVHLQVVSESFLVAGLDGFRGGVVSQLLAQTRVVHDPEQVLARAIDAWAAYPRQVQVHNAIAHLIALLGEYHRARKCVRTGHTEDAFLHLNVAFRELACVEYARRGLHPQRTLIEQLPEVSPHTYNAYVWLVHGRKGVRERVTRSFAFFERILDEIVAEIGPALVPVLRACRRPLTEERLGELPEIDDRSADLDLLVERLVASGIIRPDRRAPCIEGVTLSSLSETLLDLF